MHIKNTLAEYGLISKLLHWISAVLLFAQIPIGFYLVDLDFGPERISLENIHIIIGLSIFYLVTLRLLYKLFNPTPKLEPSIFKGQRFLAKLNHTFFIDNTNQRKSFSYNEIIQAKLVKKQNLILFPEGTTSDGNSVRSFKSSFFESTNLPKYFPKKENDFIDVCPISLCYKDKNNLPMGIFYRRYVAWQGDYPLLRLMKIFLLSGPVSIDIIIHKSVDLSNFKNRKELSNYCQDTIQNTITKELMI